MLFSLYYDITDFFGEGNLHLSKMNKYEFELSDTYFVSTGIEEVPQTHNITVVQFPHDL